jgi:hypothetical protein
MKLLLIKHLQLKIIKCFYINLNLNIIYVFLLKYKTYQHIVFYTQLSPKYSYVQIHIYISQ